MPKVSIKVLGLVEIISLGYLVFADVFRLKWLVPSRGRKIKRVLLVSMYIFISASLLACMFWPQYPYVSVLMRPVVLLMYFKEVRASLRTSFRSAVKSLTLLVSIFLYVLFFSLLAMILFEDSYIGCSTFTTLRESYY